MRRITYGELAVLNNMFDEQCLEKGVNWIDQDVKQEAFSDFCSQYEEGNDKLEVRLLGHGYDIDEDLFEKEYNKYIDQAENLETACKGYIKRAFEEMKVDLIDLNDLDESVCVEYDGGNHPDYDANPYSTVYSISLDKNGRIILEIEDCEEYDTENITTENWYWLAYIVKKWKEASGGV